MTSSKQKIKVLRIINRFNIGGPTFNVAYLTKYMNDRFETKLLGGQKDVSEASSSFILEELKIEPLIISEMKRSISLAADLAAYREIDRVIKEFRPDIVHTHAAKAGTLGRLAAIRNDVPVILHTFHGHVFHSYFNGLKTTVFKFIERYLAKRSTRIIAISSTQKHELSAIHKIARPEKIEVVPLGFDLTRFTTGMTEKRSQFRLRYGLNEEDVAIGIIGRLVPIKNHELLLQAVNHVLEDVPNARFFVVGDGESRDQLETYCSDQGIGYANNEPPSQNTPVCFTSWIKEIDVVMAGLDIVALCSLNEGTPVSLIEAQSARKPIVSTRVGGIQDIVLEGASALLSSVEDEDLFTENMIKLASDESLRKEMGYAGHEMALAKFSYERLVADMEDLYDRLIQEKRQNII